jgi:hypothetical protein
LLEDGGFAGLAGAEEEHFDLAIVFVFGCLEGIFYVSRAGGLSG